MEAFFVDPIILIFFMYGLAFFVMGLAVALESGGHILDREVRQGMTALAVFGLVHGTHEWVEMFIKIATATSGFHASVIVEILRVLFGLVISFGVLCSFGFQMLFPRRPRYTRLGTLAVLGIFGLGLWGIAALFAPAWDVVVRAADSWARYSLGVTGGLLAGLGLFHHARDYQRQGQIAVGQGWRLAAWSLMIYGLIGQSAAPPSAIFPAFVYNSETFRALFGFPVQVLRAGAAVVCTIGLLSALRALEVERQKALQVANQARLEAEAQAREELAQRQALQGELLKRTVVAQEEERARVARELHDEIGQTLTALHYSVAALRSAADSGGTITAQNMDKLGTLTDQALDDLRQLVTDLRPAQLDDLGLVAGINWLGDQAHKRLSLEVKVIIEGPKRRLPPDIETALFRVTQEALTNVARHAQVGTATICLSFEREAVTLKITDQGVGFAAWPVAVVGASLPRGVWGIVGMRERIISLGGQFNLVSTPGQGTVIRAELPIPMEAGDARE